MEKPDRMIRTTLNGIEQGEGFIIAEFLLIERNDNATAWIRLHRQPSSLKPLRSLRVNCLRKLRR